MSILVAGTIAIDNIKTPEAEAKKLLGGSASYASLSASYLSDEVRLVGIVGKDYPTEHLDMLASKGIRLDGVEHSNDDSFTWTGEYFDNMNSRTTHQVALNVLENWQPKIPDTISDAQFIVLANMSPDNQLQTLEQCTKSKFVLADTMDLWIEIANQRLHDVMEKIDLLVINDSEAREFAGTSNVIVAGDRLRAKGPRYVVIKLGEHGAILFGPDGEFFRTASFPLRELADPTGAGDSFLGGLAGYLAQQNATTPTFKQLKSAIVHASVMASFTCEAFSTRRLQKISTSDIDKRLDLLRQYTHY